VSDASCVVVVNCRRDGFDDDDTRRVRHSAQLGELR